MLLIMNATIISIFPYNCISYNSCSVMNIVTFKELFYEVRIKMHIYSVYNICKSLVLVLFTGVIHYF